MNRRSFLLTTLAASFAAALPAHAQGRKPRILLRNGWQSINIGDIGHWLGLFELLEKHQIDVEIRFWASTLEDGADELLKKRFPKVTVIKGKEQVAQAFQECDFYLSGSGSGFPAWKDAARWRKETGKPYGVMGVSLVSTEPELIETLSGAEFAFMRDGVSVQIAKEKGCKAPILEFGPDTAFGIVTLRDDASATAFMKQHGLEEGKFMICIPRYRWTPHWTIHTHRPKDETKHKRNEEMKEHDHAQLREAIIKITRETDMKVLVTCEDKTQIPLGKEMVYDPLPADVKKKTVWRDRYWLTDEAMSTFVRSAGLFGNEMHSPIMCISSGIPAVVCRFDEQTNKGFMWRDIGLNDWLFTLDNPEEVARIASTVLAIAKDPVAAKAKAEKARQIVLQKQKMEMDTLVASLKKAVKA